MDSSNKKAIEKSSSFETLPPYPSQVSKMEGSKSLSMQGAAALQYQNIDMTRNDDDAKYTSTTSMHANASNINGSTSAMDTSENVSAPGYVSQSQNHDH